MSAVYLDTETTGFDAPDVIQLAHSNLLARPDEAIFEAKLLHFKPRKPISVGAMATHNIIDADLVDVPLWTGRFELPAGCEYIVGQNIDGDWDWIGKPNVKRIDTLPLARKVWPLLDSHRLVALIYNLYPQAMARDMAKRAHNAAVDVDFCERVYFAMHDVLGRPETWEELWLISEEARIPTRFSFGKYGPRNGKPGELIAEVKRSDASYISWCLSGKCDIVNDDLYWQKALTR